MGSEWYSFLIAAPPIVLPSTSAAHMCYGLFAHSWTQRIWQTVALLMSRAELVVTLSETDGAAANHKLVAYLLRVAQGQANQPPAHWFCSLRQMQLCEVAMAKAAAEERRLISRLYSL